MTTTSHWQRGAKQLEHQQCHLATRAAVTLAIKHIKHTSKQRTTGTAMFGAGTTVDSITTTVAVDAAAATSVSPFQALCDGATSSPQVPQLPLRSSERKATPTAIPQPVCACQGRRRGF